MPMPMPLLSRLSISRRSVLLAAGTSVLAACGSSDDALPARLERIMPTDVPTPGLTPKSETPVESRVVRGPRFTLSIPSGYTEAELPSSDESIRSFGYDVPGRRPERPARVGVVVEDPAEVEVIEQSQVLAVSKSTMTGGEVRRSRLQWPGAIRAVLVDWVETHPGGPDLPYRTRQLMLQATPNAIVNVLGVAPADDYESLRLDDVLESLTITTS